MLPAALIFSIFWFYLLLKHEGGGQGNWHNSESPFSQLYACISILQWRAEFYDLLILWRTDFYHSVLFML